MSASGEVWLIEHSRKGRLLVEVMSDPTHEGFVDLKILSGRVKYASIGNNFAQKKSGMGTEGDLITVRSSFVRWIERKS